MIASLSQISTPVLIGSLVAIVVSNAIFMKWFLGKIESEPVDEPEPDEVGETADDLTTEGAIRTSAGVPRSRPIQPVEPSAPGAEAANPYRLTTLAGSSPAAAPLPVAPPAATAEPVSAYAPKPVVPAPETPAASAPISLARMSPPPGAPTASLTALPPEKFAAEPAKADSPKPEAPAVVEPVSRPTASLSPLFAAPEQPPAEGEAPPILPPLNFTKRASAPAPILEQGRAASADLIMTPNIPSPGAGQPPKPLTLEPVSGNTPALSSPPPMTSSTGLIFVDKPAAPLSSMTPAPAEATSARAEIATPSAKEMPSSTTPEMSRPAGADLIAIPAAGTSDKPTADLQAADVPKPSPAEGAAGPVGSGLILIPSSPEASPAPLETEKSGSAASGTAPSSWKTRLLGRPRIFLPTGGSAAPAPAEPASAPAQEEAAETVSEGSLKERFAELKSEVASAVKPDEPAEKSPVKVEADIPAPVQKPESSAVEPPRADQTAPEKAADEAPVILLPSTDAKAGATLGAIAESEILVAPKSETPPPPKSDVPAPEEPKPSADLAPLTEAASIPEPVEPSPEPKREETAPAVAPAPEVVASPKSSAATPAAPIKAEAPPEETAPAPNLPATIRSAEPVMNQKESTAAVLPSGGRASAQLTLGLEITSLQLTPFFKLGAVQLRSLSNVVSLHLIASQAAENPLAAGISFQIEAVDLDQSSHIKSILLKPLGQSTPTATPQPKLQVENVKLGTGNEGAIEITSSQQTSTAVQMLATFTIAAMDFTPSFEIGSLRLEPNSNSVMLRLAPSSKPTALDLPPSFEVSTVSLEGSAQLATVRLVPSGTK